MTPDDPRHGTLRGYSAHRRDRTTPCTACRRAMATDRQLLLVHGPRTVPSQGTHRRIQALSVLGYTYGEIAEACGWADRRNIGDILTRHVVQLGTRDRVAAAYEALSMTLPADDTKRRTYVRNRAAREGWLPPLAWDDIDNDPTPAPTAALGRHHVDEAVVHRILAGDLVPSSTAERREVVRRWPATGRSYRDLQDLTGWKYERYLPHQTPAEVASTPASAGTHPTSRESAA